MLAKRFGRLDTVKIWWDSKKLDGSVLFDTSIAEGIKQSAIMICLNSPGYAASRYCQQELDTFYKKAGAETIGLKVGERSRIFNVLLNNIPFKDWPAELSGTSGFPFHDAQEAGEFGDTVDTLSNAFRDQMRNVRDAVYSLLNDFNHELPDHKSGVATDSNSFSIYLGEVPDTLRSSRKRIVAELEKKGFEVLAAIPPPDEAAAHEQAASSALQQASLSIHLLDEFSGREIQGDESKSYPQKQTELALATDRPQMIWIPAETDLAAVEEEAYKQFLQGIEKGTLTQKHYDFVRGSKATVSQVIIDFATQIRDRQKQTAPAGDKLSVLVDTHFMDQLYALDLGKTLLENDIQPFINPQEDDPRKNINLMGERLSQVKKLIFLYGSVSKDWVLERMSAALQLIITNNYPIEDFFIYMAPPHKEANDISLNQRLLKVNVINSSDKTVLTEQEMHDFVSALKTGVA